MPPTVQLDAATVAAIAAAVARRLAAGQFLRVAAAARYVGFSRTTFYGLVDEPGFPKRVKVRTADGRVHTGYRRRDLDRWLDARPEARRTPKRVADAPGDS